MKILQEVKVSEVPDWRRDRNPEYMAILDRVLALSDGLALPVQCETVKEAQALQYFILGEQNRKYGKLHGKKFSVARRKETVYIAQVQNGHSGG